MTGTYPFSGLSGGLFAVKLSHFYGLILTIGAHFEKPVSGYSRFLANYSMRILGCGWNGAILCIWGAFQAPKIA
jgi:hypothetical protein